METRVRLLVTPTMKIIIDTDDVIWWKEPNTNQWLGFFTIEEFLGRPDNRATVRKVRTANESEVANDHP